MKNEKTLLYGVVGLLSGIVLTTLFTANAVNNNMIGMMNMMGIHPRQEQQVIENTNSNKQEMMGMESSMDEMMESINDKTESEFDKSFIEAMIPHHQGAIEMAKEAQKNAQHDELKKLADDIISAQTKEIKLMRQWQENWGY